MEMNENFFVYLLVGIILIIGLFTIFYFSYLSRTATVDLQKNLEDYTEKYFEGLNKKLQKEINGFKKKEDELVSIFRIASDTFIEVKDDFKEYKDQTNYIRKLEAEIRKLNAIIFRKNKQIERLKNDLQSR